MSRFDFIKGRRARRNQEASMVVTIHDAMAKRATDAVNRIIKTVTQDNAPLALNARVLQSERTKSLKKRLKIVKADYYLLKQKVAKLHNQLDSMNEDSLGNNALKYLLKNILITRAKEFEEDQTAQKMMQKLLMTDDLAYLATMTNLDQPVDARTVGQLFEIIRKMGLTVKIEIGKNANTPIDSLRTKTDITCQYVEYVDGVKE